MKNILIAVFSLLLGLASLQAAAHAKLVESVPADGSMLQQSPAALSLTFNKPVRLVKLILSAEQHGNIDFSFQPARVPSAALEFALPKLAVGNYKVEWVAMGADGHKMSGSFQFMQHVN
ncbi:MULTISPECIES: copper resistance CopC family protein [Microbulbifer]|uniref:copper resistance CopC family protein n=1 Tax=Microbulbifer TaxID=48073 RepID=UPI001CD3EC27|nr:copper resistance CopC family protein [Microbulbifer agarilyticus]MCA0900098.1 copper resistance protein CopC [Microbulbifer agarilyticus]